MVSEVASVLAEASAFVNAVEHKVASAPAGVAIGVRFIKSVATCDRVANWRG